MIRRRVWRGWYRLRWLLLDRRAMRLVRVRRTAGLDVVVLPGVLDPGVFFSSEVLVDALRASVPIGGSVLDLGTGSGIGAVAAAEAGAARVVAVDIDPTAADCARMNVARHGVAPRVEVRLGDLFRPVAGERFDIIAFNPPFLFDAADSGSAGLERALRAPRDLPARFAAGLPEHLAAGGSAIVVLSTNGDPDEWLAPLRDASFAIDRLISRDRGSEVLTAWRVSHLQAHQPPR